MSELGNERVIEDARARSEEDLKVFLTQVDSKLLTGELNRRLEEAEERDTILTKLVNSYEKRND